MSIFDTIVLNKPQKSTFDLSHNVKLSGHMGKLMPVFCQETMPGDKWKCNTAFNVMFAPTTAMLLHRVDCFVHYWFVPFRLVWDEYQKFETDGYNFADPTASAGNSLPLVPRLMMHSKNENSNMLKYWEVGSLADYLGYPTTNSNENGGGMMVSALPFRSYQLIYNEFYRDQNLIPDLEIDKSSGVVSDGSPEYEKLLTLRTRAWQKDYLTSALPWTQRGPAQSVPLVGSGTITNGPISFVASGRPEESFTPATVMSENRGQFEARSMELQPQSSNQSLVGSSVPVPSNEPATIDNHLNLRANGEVSLENGAFTIRDLRKATAIQRWLERAAYAGERFIEQLAVHWGVRSSDSRLQRPEYLGGGRVSCSINPIAQTSGTGDESSPQTTPQGWVVAQVNGSCNEKCGFTKYTEERGYIIGILSVLPKPCYSEGLPRAYRKFDLIDYAFPEFAKLGEQEIYNYEVGLRHSSDKEGTFGYAPRYAEYKFIPDTVHGQFKTTLNQFHLAREWSTDNQPNLAKDFIECNPSKRIFAVTDPNEDELFIVVNHDCMARRALPYLPEPDL